VHDISTNKSTSQKHLMNTEAKDLNKEAPASPAKRVGGYVILARMADKARADFLGGNVGEYHTGCPLDKMLLDWKGVEYDEVKKEILNGADNEQIAAYLDAHGTPKTPEEIKAFSDSMDARNPYFAPDQDSKEWYAGETAKLGLDPATTPLFKWLEADDKACH
jgi:hypothetical protein